MANALIITRANDRTFAVAALDSQGDPADLTDAYLWFTAKHSVQDTDEQAAIRKNSDDGVAVIGDPLEGNATVTLLAADTADLPDRGGRRGLVLHCDVKVFDSEGRHTTLATFVLVVAADVTRVSTP